jgi:hypothetical protein
MADSERIIKMKIGVGFSNVEDAYTAGMEVIRNAMSFKDIDRADLILAFRTGASDLDEFYQGLRAATGNDAPILGGSAVGVITNDHLSYKEVASGAVVISSDNLRSRIISAGDLDIDEEKTGMRLGEALSLEQDGKLVLLFYDSIKRPPVDNMPPVLNASSLLLSGIYQRFTKATPIIGAGLIGDYDFNPTRQFCGSFSSNQKAVATILNGNFNIHTCITHGCTPLDGIYHKITKIDGAIIFELDGRPISHIIDEIYASKSWRSQQPVKLLTIGVDAGEKFAMPDESTCVNRLILGALPDGEGISIFEADLQIGTMIRFMMRDADEMMNSAKKNSEAIIARIKSKNEKPVFGLYIDCAGRTAEYQNITMEEASVVQDVFNSHNIPLLGFYSGVEIVPMPEKSRGLDWTGVLLVFTEGKN